MADQKKHKSEKLDDSLNLDFGLDSDGMDFDIDTMRDDRSPVTKVKDSFIEGMKDGVQDSSFIKRTMKDMLPRGYGKTIDFAGDMSNKVGAEIAKAQKELGPGIKELKKSLAKAIPRDSKYIPDKIKDVLKGWGEEHDKAKDTGPSEDEQRESMLALQMTQIYKAQANDAAKLRKETESKDAVKLGIQAIQHRGQMGVLSDVAASVARLDQFTRSVNLNFMKKSTELQFRQLFALQDINKVGQKQLELLANNLPAIAKNTGLPDFVKQTGTEFMMEFNKRRLAEAAGTHLFGTTTEYLQKTIQALGTKIRSSVKEGLETINMSIQDIQDAIEMASSTGKSLKEIIAEMGGNSASQKLAGKLAGMVGDKFIKNNKSIVRMGLKGARAVSNINETLEEFRQKNKDNTESGLWNAFKRVLAGAMPGATGDRTVSGTNTGNEVGGAALYTNRTDKSINDVIPGYLARILREIQVFHSGGKDVELTTFDYDKAEFISKSEMKKRVESKVFDKYSATDLGDNLKEIFEFIEKTTGKRMTEAGRKALRTRMAHNAKAGRAANEANLGNAAIYEDQEGAAEAAAAFTTFSKKADIETKGHLEARHRNLTNFANTHTPVQNLIDQGHQGLLKEMGILTEDGSAIDSSKMLEHYLKMDPSAHAVQPALAQRSILNQALGGMEGSDPLAAARAKVSEHAGKLQQGAMNLAQRAASSMGLKGTASMLAGEQGPVSAADALRALMGEAGQTKAGKYAAGQLSAVTKAIETQAQKSHLVGKGLEVIKQGVDSLRTGTKGAKAKIEEHTKSLLQRSMVDGEIDYEVLAKELVKYPPIIRTAITKQLQNYKQYVKDLWKSKPDEKKDAPKEIPVGEAGKVPGADPEVKQFAKGGVFSGTILKKPVDFVLNTDKGEKRAVAGEAGQEAVMPVSDGGVQLLDQNGMPVGLLQLARDKLGRLSVTSTVKQLKDQADRLGDTAMAARAKSKFKEHAKKLNDTPAAGHVKALVEEHIKQLEKTGASAKFFDLVEKAKSLESKGTGHARAFYLQKDESGQHPWRTYALNKLNEAKAYGQAKVNNLKGQEPEDDQTPGGSLVKLLRRMQKTLAQQLERLDVIAAKDMGYAPNQSLIKSNLKWIGGRFVSLAKLPVGAATWAAGGAMKLAGKGILGAASGTFGLASSIGKFGLGAFRQLSDVWVDGESEPRVYASGIRAGKYTRKISKDVLKSHKDIDEPILNEEGNTVISGDELDRLVYRSRNKFVRLAVRGKRLLGKGLGIAGKGIAGLFGMGMRALSFELSVMRKVASVAGRVMKAGYDYLGREVDIFTPGLEKPVLVAALLKQGYYRSKVNGHVIYRYKDIDGPVMDAEGREVVTIEMLQAGLYDYRGRPIVGKGMRIFSKIMRGIGAVARFGKRAVVGSAKLAWKATKGIYNMGAGLVKGVGKFLTGGMGGVLGMGTGGAVGGDENTQLLAEIRDILKSQYGSPWPDSPTPATGIGGRLKSKFSDLKKNGMARAKDWKERIKDSTRSAADKAKKVGGKIAGATAVAEANEGIMSMLGKLVEMASSARLLMTGGSLLAGEAATGAAVVAGTEAAVGGTVLAGAEIAAVAGGGTMLATAGAGILTLGAALAAFVTAPATLGIMALAATSYGIWKGVQFFKNRLTALDKLRLVQYGFHADDTDAYTRVIKMERMLQEKLVTTKTGVEIMEDKVQLKDLMGLFDLDPEKQEDVSLFAGWYRGRFKPVFLTHATALKQLSERVDFDKISSLKDDKAKQYVQIAAYSDGPYSYTAIPKKEKGYEATTGGDVNDIIKQVKAEIGCYSRTTPVQPITDEKPDAKPTTPEATATGVQDKAALNRVAGTSTAATLSAFGAGDAESEPKGGGTATATKGAIDAKANPQGLRLAGGQLLDGRNGYNLIRQSGSKLNLKDVNPALLKQFFGAVEEYYQLTGKRVTVTDGFRTYEEQAKMKREKGSMAAAPGTSAHEFGLALDVDSKDLNALDDLGLLRKYGLTRPVGGEPWHLEPAGTQLNMDLYKRNAQLASRAIEEGVGRGGGGFGTVSGAKPDDRNMLLAQKILDAKVDVNVTTQGVDANKKQTPSAVLMSAADMVNKTGMASATPVKLGMGFAGGDAEPKPAASAPVTGSSQFADLPSTPAVASVGASVVKTNAKAPSVASNPRFNTIASPSSAFGFNPHEIAAGVADNSAGGSILRPTEIILGKSLETLGDIKSVLTQIYTAMTGEQAKALKTQAKVAETTPAVPAEPAPPTVAEKQAAQVAKKEEVKAEQAAQAVKPADPLNPTGEAVAPRSALFSLPTLPIAMRRAY